MTAGVFFVQMIGVYHSEYEYCGKTRLKTCLQRTNWIKQNYHLRNWQLCHSNCQFNSFQFCFVVLYTP